MEGWKEKKKESMIVERAEQEEVTASVSIHLEGQGDALTKEAEDNKRKKDEQSIPEGKKAKKRKLEKLEGWGLGSIPLEGKECLEVEEDKPVQKWDWKDVTGCLVVDTGMEQRSRQASIKEWTQQEKDEERNVPVGRNEKMKKPPLRGVRGKLSKKEQVEMKRKHKDIAWLLAPTKETVTTREPWP